MSMFPPCGPAGTVVGMPQSGAVPMQPSIGRVGDRDRVAPVDQAVADRADVRAVGAVGPQPLAELLRVGGPRGALADRRADLADRHGQRIARLGPLDPDRAGQRVAVRHLGLVAAVGVAADLAREGVLGLDDDRLARLDPQAGLVVPAELVVQRSATELG